MKKKNRKTRRPEERAAELERRADLTHRLEAAIDHYRARLGPSSVPEGMPIRKHWLEMSREERAAERERSRDLDRRLLAAIERYRTINAEKRGRREAEAS